MWSEVDSTRETEDSRLIRSEESRDETDSDLNTANAVPMANTVSQQWSFRETGTTETLACEAEIGVWVQAPGTLLWESEVITPGKVLRLYMQNPEIWCIFGRKMVRNAVHNAFFNTLTMGTPSHAFRQLFNNGNGVPTRSPSK